MSDKSVEVITGDALFVRVSKDLGGGPYETFVEIEDSDGKSVKIEHSKDGNDWLIGPLYAASKAYTRPPSAGVPEEPTEEMLEACLFSAQSKEFPANAKQYLRRVWKTMISKLPGTQAPDAYAVDGAQGAKWVHKLNSCRFHDNDHEACAQYSGQVPCDTSPSAGVPEGFALVPIEPTQAMVDAAEDAHMPFGDMDLAIRCAVLAAPQPPKQEGE